MTPSTFVAASMASFAVSAACLAAFSHRLFLFLLILVVEFSSIAVSLAALASSMAFFASSLAFGKSIAVYQLLFQC
ncbi:hypothetical protein H1220_01955 [Carnobacteriaceae bacterium zg-84]|nr:hypothetical protein H1220_01955 [Carnobacteriaceae bacterium zg-84]